MGGVRWQVRRAGVLAALAVAAGVLWPGFAGARRTPGPEAATGGIVLRFTREGFVLGFARDGGQGGPDAAPALRVDFVDGRGTPPVTERDAAPGGGGDGALPSGRVLYPDVWDGVTVIYERSPGSIMKSTYRIAPHDAPGAVDRIRLRYSRPVRLAANGELVTALKAGEMVERAPVAWQEIGDERRLVAVSFVLRGDREVGFRAEAYDPRHPLVIDPDMAWNTFLGCSGGDCGYAAAVDGSGNVYVAGYSSAAWGSPVRAYTAGTDGLAARLTAAGELAWHSFVGGTGTDYVRAAALDGGGSALAAGYSNATWGDAPVRGYTAGFDAFAAELPDGPTLVELVSLEAAWLGDRVRLTWETASELDTAGFHVWRCGGGAGAAARLRLTEALLPSRGGPSCGATYAFEDAGAMPGALYA